MKFSPRKLRIGDTHRLPHMVNAVSSVWRTYSAVVHATFQFHLDIENGVPTLESEE